MTQSQPRNGPKAKRDPSGTQDVLLESASELFAERGFDGATAELIAEAAGVNKAMINYHFGGKEGLYRACLEQLFAGVESRLTAIRAVEASPEEKLDRYIAAFAELNTKRPTFARLVLREILSGGRFLDEVLLPRFLAIFETIRAIVWQGMREGTFRAADPLMTHLSIVGVLVFFFATAQFRERLASEKKLPVQSPSEEKFVAHVRELISHGLMRADAPARGEVAP
jgi:AcrR family transcriptional regulator